MLVPEVVVESKRVSLVLWQVWPILVEIQSYFQSLLQIEFEDEDVCVSNFAPNALCTPSESSLIVSSSR